MPIVGLGTYSVNVELIQWLCEPFHSVYSPSFYRCGVIQTHTHTNQVTGEQCEQAVKDAIDLGYRHIDTAYLYGNEKEIGNGIRAKIADGTVRREELFVTTKVSTCAHFHRARIRHIQAQSRPRAIALEHIPRSIQRAVGLPKVL